MCVKPGPYASSAEQDRPDRRGKEKKKRVKATPSTAVMWAARRRQDESETFVAGWAGHKMSRFCHLCHGTNGGNGMKNGLDAGSISVLGMCGGGAAII
jgi:hypothetical protein